MKIVENRTSYPNSTLRSITCAIHRDLSKTEGKLSLWGSVKVRFVYSRRGHVTGCATYNGTFMKVRLPRGRVSMRRAALVIDHEIHHLYGFRHGQFSVASWDHRPESTWDWVAARFGEWLTEAEPKAKAKPDRSEVYAKKMAALESRISKRERRIRLDTAAVKRLRVKLSGMARRAAAYSPIEANGSSAPGNVALQQ